MSALVPLLRWVSTSVVVFFVVFSARVSAENAPELTLTHQALPMHLDLNQLYALPTRWRTDLGTTESLDALKGKYVVLGMFFTSCRRICPQTIIAMKSLEDQLLAQGITPTLVLVSYSAEAEDAHSLADYRKTRRLDGRWHLLAGDAQSTRQFADILGLADYNSLDEHVFHDFRVVAVSPLGAAFYLDWDHRDPAPLVEALAHSR